MIFFDISNTSQKIMTVSENLFFLEQNRSHFYTDTEVGAVFSVFEKVYPFDQSQLL